MRLNTRYFKIAGILYLAIPVIIFLLGWLKLYISIPLSVCILYVLYTFIKNVEDKFFEVEKSTFFLIISIIGLWVLFSGIGGYMWQNNDHVWRNALFNDLCNNDWPIYDKNTDSTFCYYMGFWLIPALFTKIFSSIEIGFFIQYLWGVAGATIVYFLICEYIGKIKFGILAIFIFFSGLDIISYFGFSVYYHGISDAIKILTSFPHIEWCNYPFQASSITTMIFWVFNQALPTFIVFLLVLLQKNTKQMWFVLSLLLIFSPFAFIGLIPIIIYLEFKNFDIKNIARGCAKTFSIQNITALFIVILFGLYFMSNEAEGHKSIVDINAKTLLNYTLYIVFQFAVFIILIYKKFKSDKILWILFLSVCLFAFIFIGRKGDFHNFCMRTNIPLILYLMLLFSKQILDKKISTKFKMIMLTVFIIGSITPIFEFGRTLRNTKNYLIKEKSMRRYNFVTIFGETIQNKNFMGDKNSIFFKYLAQKYE